MFVCVLVCVFVRVCVCACVCDCWLQFLGYPIVPGFEFAGYVSAVQAGVVDLAIGDAVFGYATPALPSSSRCDSMGVIPSLYPPQLSLWV